MRWMLLFVSMVCLLGCTQTDSTPAAPDAVVEQYLQARITGDAAALQQLACLAWEEQAALEADSLQGLSARLEGMTCRPAGENVVQCEGQLVATYNGEQREFPLGRYQVVLEDGAWKFCGEAP